MKRSLLIAASICLIASPASAQERLGRHPWGRWGPTFWKTMESRVKCDGQLPFGSSTRFLVDIRNVGEAVVFFDYVITWNGNAREEPKPKRVSIAPKKHKELSIEMDIDCNAEVLIRITNVRAGGDTEDIPYLPPETRAG